MKAKVKRKILSLLMAAIMVMGLLPTEAWAETVEAGTSSDLKGPEGNTGVASTYQHIYYGKYNGSPIKWRILDKSSSELLLLADDSVDWRAFDNNSNDYENSDVYNWLNGEFQDSFTTEEKANFRYPAGEKAFLLSTDEANNPTYFPGGKADREGRGRWWLRSPGYGSSSAVLLVDGNGDVDSRGRSVTFSYGIRPAFKLNLSSVIFVSDAVGGASATVESNLSAVTPITGDMKLTMADSSQTLTIGDVNAGSRTSGSAITVNYSDAFTGDSNYLGVELTSGSNTYRGVIKNLTADNESGTATFNLPVALSDNSYTLRFWNEKYSEPHHTKYANTPVSESITFMNPNIVSDSVSLPTGIIGTPYYNGALTALDGTGSYTWSANGLPAGLSIAQSTGEISGTPEDTGNFNVRVTVTDVNGKTDEKDFTLTINQTFSIDLVDLTVSAGSLSPAFDKNTVVYQVEAVPNIDSIDVTAQLADAGATLTIAGDTAADSVAKTVYLEQGANLIPVVVTASDGVSQKAYILSINGTVDNADLSSLTLSEGNLSFDKDTTEYYVNAGNDTETIDISAIPSDNKALVLIDGSVTTSSAITVEVGENPIDVMVVAQDASTKTYTVTVNRGTGDVNLSDITLSEGTLSLTFNLATTAYTATVPYNTEAISISPTLMDGDATVRVNGGEPSQPVSLDVGENAIDIVVTGKDGESTKTYTITVTRKEALTINNETLPIGIVGGTYQATLSAEGGTLPYTWTATGLPTELILSEITGEITGTFLSEGNYTIEVKVTDTNGSEVSKTLTLNVNLGCGNGAYIIQLDEDSAYTRGYTDDGIPMMTVNEGITGFKYFSVAIAPVTGHGGNEVCVFVHLRNGQQIGINATEADFDTVNRAKAAFNVKEGDIIKAFIVDDLTNNSETNPEIL
ncbi:hypothetical protein J2Z76_002791 [Sedimentibacter acidaminivorans]|uniref:Cadherin-like beta sandwich domain-containing protein n=1 Tax=Sedimentibacter acidaminivorans TaxID=913099 RepID=A0ABS4GGY5_9FIRM|nr:cadherin-like beta sandwich domain-containing protein [Sedimentibacter acidaminivorans]MBP1926919.1 hypothetical protein [Sedimentibacter acidaminivorans]